MTAKAVGAAAFTLIVSACTLPGAPGRGAPGAVSPSGPPTAESTVGAPPRYRCDQGMAFTVRFADGTATIDAGPRGTETLLRDAGGLTPQQTVYSSTRMRAAFGLGPEGRGAKLNFLAPALEVTCFRE